MKKILTIVGASALTILLTTGCGSSPEASGLEMSAHIDASDESTVKTAIFVGHAKTKDIMHIIEVAAKKDGWRVTKFKSDSVIVEKNVDGIAMTSTLKYHNEHISGTKDKAPEDYLMKLRKAIVSELKKEAKSH